MLEDQPRDQVGCWRSLPGDQNAGEPTDGGSACGRQGGVLPCLLVIGEAALAADLITELIFSHLERNLAAVTPTRRVCGLCHLLTVLKIVQKLNQLWRPDLGIGEAASPKGNLFIIFQRFLGGQGGCVSARLDHGFQVPPGRLH